MDSSIKSFDISKEVQQVQGIVNKIVIKIFVQFEKKTQVIFFIDQKLVFYDEGHVMEVLWKPNDHFLIPSNFAVWHNMVELMSNRS